MENDSLIEQIERLTPITEGDDEIGKAEEVDQRVTTLMVHVYGKDSPQLKNLRKSIDGIPDWQKLKIFGAALRALEEDIASGLVGGLTKQITGGVLSDFILLARNALNQKEEGAKNVAAVLAAAVYEDTIRRMAREFAGVLDRDKLESVLIVLKEKEILQGPQFGIAQSFLQFRNDALHADWDKIERTSIEPVLGFVQELLAKHFSE